MFSPPLSYPNVRTPFLLLLLLIPLASSNQSACLNSTQIREMEDQLHYTAEANNQTVTISASEQQESSILARYKDIIERIGASYLIEIEDDKYYIHASRNQIDESTLDWQNQAAITDYVGLNAEQDFWIYVKPQPVILSCESTWTVKIGCGTFLEVHYPYSEGILVSKKIEELNGPINLSINELCAGQYHIWFVYVTRIGRVVKTVEPIFVTHPLCKC